MSILNQLFGGAQKSQQGQQPKQQGQQQQQQQQNISEGTNPNTPSGVSAPVPGLDKHPTANAGSDGGASPLDGFKDLWKPSENKESATNNPAELDPAKLQEVVSKANFASSLSPEVMQKALSGDQQAFMSVMNTVAQQSFMQATLASNKMIEQAIAARFDKHQQELPSIIKRNLVSEKLADNPLYSHEATRPILSALESQLTAKFPNATSEQISAQARQFLQEFATVAGGKDAAATASAAKASSEPDWSSFL